jgi:nucleoside-triphosphatase THEP1
MNIQTGERFEMEAEDRETEILKIGKYRFKKKSFNKAITTLQQSLNEKKGWLVIDEIGPLELRKEGFYKILNEILGTKTSLQIILVVRNSLIEEVINFFRLSEYKIEFLNTGSEFFKQ